MKTALVVLFVLSATGATSAHVSEFPRTNAPSSLIVQIKESVEACIERCALGHALCDKNCRGPEDRKCITGCAQGLNRCKDRC